MPDRRVEPYRSNVMRMVKDDIAQRLRPVCAHLPPDEFDSLIEHMATVKIKFSLRRVEGFFGALPGDQSEN